MSVDLGSSSGPTTALALQKRPISFPEFMSDIAKYTTLATSLAKSGRAGESATPEKVLATLCMGAELGIPPMTAAQNIFAINGKLTISVGLATSLLYRDYPQASLETIDDGQTCVCRLQIPGRKLVETKFSQEDAKRAGLVKKDSNWEKYPDDMRYSKAVLRAIRRAAPDVLCGLYTPEEIESAPQTATVATTNPATTTIEQPTTDAQTSPPANGEQAVDVAFVETVDAEGEITTTPISANGSGRVEFENKATDLADPKRKNPVTATQKLALKNLKQEMGISNADWLAALGRYACKSANYLTEADAGEFITALMKQKRELAASGKSTNGVTAAASSK